MPAGADGAGHFQSGGIVMQVFAFLAASAIFVAPSAHAQSTVTSGEIITGLAGSGRAVEAAGVDLELLRRDIAQRITAEGKGTENAASPPPVLQALAALPNLTLVIEFDFDSDRIRPQSYPAIARIADALHHPVLLGYRFLVAGHTDGKGSRDYNFELSQRRANAVVEALVTTFRIEPDRLGALGLGEEQLRNPGDPDGAINRRVQILNLGPL
jgi:outer membrane protein OmpA-like peptidoglycan-associated protein